MKEFDIAIISSYHEEILAADWYFTIQSMGKRCLIITPNPNEYNVLTKQGVDTVYLNDYFPDKTPSRAEIDGYFRKKGVDDMVKYVSTERAYYKQGNNHIIRYAYRYAEAFTRVFEEYTIGIVLHAVQGGEVVRRCASLIADEKKIRVIYLGETFIPHTINLYYDEHRTMLEPKEKRTMAEEDAQKFIDDKIQRKPVIFYETEHRRYVRTPLLKKFFTLIKEGNWNIIRAYFVSKWTIQVDRRVKDFYTRIVGTFHSFNKDARYFYYPFNVDAESELYIRNYEYIDQAGVIEKLSAHLPAGYKLYVKTHPGVEGHLSINAYRRLSRLPNVVVLHAKVNSFDVVKSSQGVIIVSSTVGVESYIMGKPTCVIGHWPYVVYGNFPATKNLSEVFDKLLSPTRTPNEPVKFIQNLYAGSIEGSLWMGHEDFKKMVAGILALK
jgi:capsule polysaccharide modification protein KpsS